MLPTFHTPEVPDCHLARPARSQDSPLFAQGWAPRHIRGWSQADHDDARDRLRNVVAGGRVEWWMGPCGQYRLNKKDIRKRHVFQGQVVMLRTLATKPRTDVFD